MNSLTQYIKEAKETYTINGIKVKEGEPIWIDKDGKAELVTLDAVYGSKLIYKVEDDYGKEKMFSVPTSSFIETDKMAIKRQKAELKKGKSSSKDEKIKKQIIELEQELEELNSDMENDPDVLAELKAGGGKVTDEYGRRQNKLYDKIEKLRNQLSESIDETAGPGPAPTAPPPAAPAQPTPPPPPGPGCNKPHRPGMPMFGGPLHRPVGIVNFIKNNNYMSFDELTDWCKSHGACADKPSEPLTDKQAKEMAKDIYEYLKKGSDEPKLTKNNISAAIAALDKWEKR